MSVEKMALVLNHSKAPTPLARLVLVGIANHDGDGGSWPAVETLARYAGVSTRSVQRAIRDLVECGEIVVHTNDGGSRWTRRDRRPNRYEITVTPDDGVSSVSPRVTTNGVTNPADGVTSVSPEPSLEPSSLSSPRTSSSEPVSVECEIGQRASDLAARFCSWYRSEYGVDPPQEKGRLGVRAVYLACLKRGVSEDEIRRASKALDGPLTVGRIMSHRNKLRVVAGDRWAVPE